MGSRGELEQHILEVLWAASDPMSVADVQGAVNVEKSLAYTTVMTVLDRLAKKGLVTRELVGRAWRYRSAISQAELLTQELAAALEAVPQPVRRDALVALAERLPEDERAALLAH